MSSYPSVYHVHEYDLSLGDSVLCLACALFFISVITLALYLVTYSLIHLYKSKRLQDRLKVEEKLVVASKPQKNLFKNESLQNSVNDIERWMTSAGINHLSTLSSPENFSTMSESEICTVILLELITCDRTRTLQLIIDSLHDNFNDILASALAHLITVALNFSPKDPNTVSPIAKLLDVSPDSFVFDYIYIALINENGMNKKTILPRISVSKGTDELDQYNTFLYSSTPSIGKFGLFFSNIPIVNRLFASCKIMKSDDLIPKLLEYAVSARVEQEIADMCDEIESLQSFLQLPDKNKNKIGPKIITTDMIYDNVVENHYSVLSSIKKYIVQFLQEIQIFDDIQNDRFLASSPLISVHIMRVKRAYKSMINRYKQLEHSLLQWERAYVISQICAGEIFFSYEDIKSQLNKVSATKDRCLVITHELNELTQIIKKNEKRAFTLYETFFKNDNLLDEEMKELCKQNILKVLEDYRNISKLNQMFNDISENLLGIVQLVQQGSFELGRVHLDDISYVQENYDRIGSTLCHIQNDIFAFAYDRFITLSGKEESLKFLIQEDNATVQSDIILLFFKVILVIFDHVEMELTELKKALQKSNDTLMSLKEPFHNT